MSETSTPPPENIAQVMFDKHEELVPLNVLTEIKNRAEMDNLIHDNTTTLTEYFKENDNPNAKLTVNMGPLAEGGPNLIFKVQREPLIVESSGNSHSNALSFTMEVLRDDIGPRTQPDITTKFIRDRIETRAPEKYGKYKPAGHNHNTQAFLVNPGETGERSIGIEDYFEGDSTFLTLAMGLDALATEAQKQQ